jgi:hypothetical protein
MRLLLLAMTLAIAANAAAADTAGLRVFYCIHAERPCKETTEEVPIGARDSSMLARKVMATKDDFIGFTDAHHDTLQFYVEEPDSILVDMPMPQLKGSYSMHVNRAEALRLIAGLAPPLSRYRASLKLKFAKWQ